MKTIKSFLLGTVLLLATIALITLSIKSLINSNQLYQVFNTNEPIDLTYLFILNIIVCILIAVATASYSFAYFQQFSKYYHNYLVDKRKRDIQKQLLEAKHTKLQEDLIKAKTLDEKEALIYDFYHENNTGKPRIVFPRQVHKNKEDNHANTSAEVYSGNDNPWNFDDMFIKK